MPRLVLFAVAIMAISPLPKDGNAQSGALLSLYGEGVHAFFNRNFSQASTLIGDAISQGLQDPRAHYFRGVAHHRSGKLSEAQYDFEEGARLEMSAGGSRLVGRAIERIQGPVRLELERYRRDARILADRQRPRPANPTPDFGGRIKEEMPEFPPNEDLMPEPADVPEKSDQPFGAAPEDETGDPVPGDPPPVDDDPFGESSAEEPFGKTDEAAPDEDDDPFGESNDTAPAEDDPFSEVDDDDPFSWLRPQFFLPEFVENDRSGLIRTETSRMTRKAKNGSSLSTSPYRKPNKTHVSR